MVPFAPVNVLGHLALASVTALIVGAVDGFAAGWLTQHGLGVALYGALLGAGLAAPIGLAVGAAQGVAFAVLRRLPLWRRLAGSVSSAWVRFAAGDRDGVLVLHAMGAAILLLAAGFVLVVRRIAPALWELPEAAFGQTILVALVVLGLAGASIALIPLAALLHAALRQVERLVRIPWPRPAAVRYLLYVAVPASALLVPFVQEHHRELGAAGAGPALLLFVVIEGAVWHALRGAQRLARFSPRAVVRLRAGAVLAGLGALGATVALWDAASPAAGALERSWLSGGEASLLRRASDVDRDGFSSLLGGGDCAPFDRRRSPGARDEPGNAIDEDCNGVDATAAGGPRLRRYLGTLDPSLVRRWNVVWIIVDALRADHVGALGYKRHTTPYLDALAAESLLFSQARSQSSGTDLSIPSMMAGQDPSSMDWLTDRPFYGLGPGVTTLAERLDDLGYRSAMYVNAWIHKNVRDYGRGFQEARSTYAHDEWKIWSKRSSPLTTTRAIERIERWDIERQRAPFFLALYYEDPHHTYEVHGDKGYPTFGSSDVDRFDGEIAFADRNVGVLLEHLRHKPEVWDNTVVIVTADHGEEFREHGGRFHNRTCYEESTRVPLIVRVPGLPPQRIDAPVALVDVVPAILELLGVAEDDPRLTGQSLLVPALDPNNVTSRVIPCAVHTRNQGANGFKVRSVVVDGMKLIHNVIEGTWELYDLEADPRERRSLSDHAEHAETLERLRRVLDQTTRVAGGRPGT